MRFSAELEREAAHSYVFALLDSDLSISRSENVLAGHPLPPLAELERAPWVAILGDDLYPLFLDARAGVAGSLDHGKSTVAILIAWRNPPDTENRKDGDVTSVLCSGSLFRELISRHAGSSPERLCFLLLSAILAGEISADRVLVKQLPIHRRDTGTAPTGRARVIMAHRGFSGHLRVALRSIEASTPKPAVSVGLDGGSVSEYKPLLQDHAGTDFFSFSPAPLGPYVIRQELIERSGEPVLIFQDSDDYATSDRFAILGEELQNDACDFVGSHELRIDQSGGNVTAVRYPLDVNSALNLGGPGHSLLYGTSAITRSAFFKAGGLSTDHIFSGDTQFLLRAYFALRIRNADAFLYLRRLHEHSLTVHPSTGEFELRETLHRPWRADFISIRKGVLSLDNSSLHRTRRSEPYQVTRF